MPYYNPLKYSQVIYNGTNSKYKQIQRKDRTEWAGIVRKDFLEKLTTILRSQGIGGIIVFSSLHLPFLLK